MYCAVIWSTTASHNVRMDISSEWKHTGNGTAEKRLHMPTKKHQWRATK